MQSFIQSLNIASEFYFDEGCYIVEVSNSSKDPECSIVRARVESGVTTELHCLQNTIERYVIIEGEGSIQLGSLSPQKVRVGDVVVIPALCSQKISNTGANDLIFFAICTPRFETKNYQRVT